MISKVLYDSGSVSTARTRRKSALCQKQDTHVVPQQHSRYLEENMMLSSSKPTMLDIYLCSFVCNMCPWSNQPITIPNNKRNTNINARDMDIVQNKKRNSTISTFWTINIAPNAIRESIMISFRFMHPHRNGSERRIKSNDSGKSYYCINFRLSRSFCTYTNSNKYLFLNRKKLSVSFCQIRLLRLFLASNLAKQGISRSLFQLIARTLQNLSNLYHHSYPWLRQESDPHLWRIK
jgi:hypothetical protein